MDVATTVVRNDSLTLDEIESLAPAAIVISPGPCTPLEAGISTAIVSRFQTEIPILGVCLGHQAIASACGGRIIQAPQPRHGRTSMIEHHAQRLFADCPSPLSVGRYHSLIVDDATLPDVLHVTARSEDGIVMGIEHDEAPLFGVQFHPESILTDCGHRILHNFLTIAGIDHTWNMPAGDLGIPNAIENDFYQQQLGETSYRPM